MVCRLYMPDVGINVALFNVTDMKNPEKQPLVDAADSGIWQELKNLTVIGDHAGDGFDASANLIPDVSKCYLQTGANVKAFLCVEKCIGYNVISYLLDEDQNSLTSRTGYALLSYCCANQSGTRIHYVFWVPVEE
mgnify:CR=1 FL=1